MAIKFGDVAAVSGSCCLNYDGISAALCLCSGGMCDSPVGKHRPRIAPGHLVNVSVLQELVEGS